MSSSRPEIDVTRLMASLRAHGGEAAMGLKHALPQQDLQLPRLGTSRQLARRKSVWRLHELLQFHDEDFVANAYLALLHRDADAAGFEHYLSALRSGDLTKIGILGRLRYSREGRRRGARVQGLMPRFFKDGMLHLPVVGYVLSVGYFVWRLPRVVANIQVFEAWSNQLHCEHSKQVNLALETVEQHFNMLDRRSNAAAVGFRHQLDAVRTDLETLAREAVTDLRAQVDAIRGALEKPGSAALPEGLYKSLEDHFRGSRREVKEKLSIYLPILTSLGDDLREAPVLDAGCGRGEWLELLEQAGFSARGVDTNGAMIACCRDLGLDVLHAEIIAHLRLLPGNCLCCVSAFHIIEHLPANRLIEFFTESRRVLRPGGVLICETPNPENIFVGACRFYFDPTHRNPLPPELTEFLAKSVGFEQVQINRVNGEASAFRGGDRAGVGTSAEAFLRRHFYSPADYALVANKANA